MRDAAGMSTPRDCMTFELLILSNGPERHVILRYAYPAERSGSFKDTYQMLDVRCLTVAAVTDSRLCCSGWLRMHIEQYYIIPNVFIQASHSYPKVRSLWVTSRHAA